MKFHGGSMHEVSFPRKFSENSHDTLGEVEQEIAA